MPDPTAPQPADNSLPLIGVFDSGLGGLSVLSALHRQRPDLPLLYLADSGHAPYGERSDEFVIGRSALIARHLVDAGAQLLVIACNTATAVAIGQVRAQWPQLPVVGVEPAIKPAVAASPQGRIGVMATPITLHSDKFRQLAATYRGEAQLVLQACPGLAGLIEQGDLQAPALLDLIEVCCRPLRAAQVDSVVLGCTHYPFVRRHIQAAMGPEVQLIDTAEAVARQALKRLGLAAQANAASPAHVHLQTTGDLAHLQTVARDWLDFPVQVSAVRAE